MAWVGPALGAVGSLASAFGGGQPAAPKFRPYDVTSGLGTSDWDRKAKTLNTTLSPEQQAFANQYNQMAHSYLQGGPTAGFQNFTNGSVQGMFPGLLQNSFDSSATNPQSLTAYLNNLSGVAGTTQGMFGQAGQMGMNAFNNPAPGSAQANAMFGAGQGLLGSTPQSYNDVFNQRLGLLRDQAAPQEARAQDSFLQRMYSMGQMGSTSGQRNTEGFAQGLAQADTTRQLDAMNLSESLYGRDQAAALQNRGIGAGLMGNGLQGMLQGYGAQGDRGQSLLGLSGQFGSQLGNMYGAGYGAQQNFNDLTNTRAQQRMANATSLFGLGNQLGQQSMQQGTQFQQMPYQMQQALMDQANMGRMAGQGAMSQGNFQSGGNPLLQALGAGLSGFGGAMTSGALQGMFGGNVNPISSSQAGAAFSQIPSFNPQIPYGP